MCPTLACLHVELLASITSVCCGALAPGHVTSDLAPGLEAFCSSFLIPADFWPSQEQCSTKADLTDKKTTDSLFHCPVPTSQHHRLRNYPDLMSLCCWREKGSRAKHKWPCCILFSSGGWLCKYKFMGGGASAEAVTVGFFFSWILQIMTLFPSLHTSYSALSPEVHVSQTYRDSIKHGLLAFAFPHSKDVLWRKCNMLI